MPEHDTPADIVEQRVAAIPKLLRSSDRWIGWGLVKDDKGKDRKAPSGSTKDPGDWGPFADLASRLREGAGSGVGFVLTGTVPVEREGETVGHLMAIDIDGCLDPADGCLTPWAKEILDHYPATYTERTPSGTGLRPWVVVRALPAEKNVKLKIRDDDARLESVTKEPNVQLFGCGPACYVTVTGERWVGSGEIIAVVDDLAWLFERFEHGRGRAASTKPTASKSTKGAGSPLPIGTGPVPEGDEIERRVAGTEKGRAFLAGRWMDVLGQNPKDRSPSAAYWLGARMVLDAARGHGEAAARFLYSDRTPWGRGEVKDSREPGRFARGPWVEAEIARVAARSRDVEAVFAAAGDSPAADPPAGDPPRRRFRPIGELVAEGAHVEWLFRNMLPRACVAEILGEPNAGKSTVAASMVAHVLAGRDWIGARNKAGAGWVAYVCAEGARGMRSRFDVALRAAGVDPTAAKLHVLEGAVALCSPTDARWLREQLAALREIEGEPPRLVVLDTLARNLGGDENNAEDAGAATDVLHEIARGGTCVVYLHHPGHGAKDRGRGSSSLRGTMDVGLKVSKIAGGVRIKGTKARDSAEFRAVRRALEVVEIGSDPDDGTPITTVVLGDGPPKPGAFDPVGRVDPDDPVLAYLARNAHASFSELAAAVGLSTSAAKRRTAALQNEDRLRRNGSRGPWVVAGFEDDEDDDE